ncbi:MAG: glutamate-1-semialdehyde 2,1-aminomutase [Sedimentisphaerales bacterium]|nr:glutamate-1-semialdehyde 2,1-aminomutase [Sedimentisphaerales bacterium]
MSQSRTRHEELMEQARSLIPGGVNSPVRAFGGVGGTPVFMERAQGAYLWDVTGKQYIDYVGSWGPCILGHATEKVINAIKAAADKGTSFGTATAAEIDMARRVIELVPSIKMLRLVNSGTEATMSALRLARAFTGRDKVIKFAGCYHGHGDSFLVKAGSGATTLGTPTSPGVTPATASDTLIAEFNDINSVKELIKAWPDTITAVIVEPVVGNAGVIPPVDGFLSQLREVTSEHDILLIFDEVMTGFRLSPGGAQQLYQIMPDLTTLGKIIGGGLPIGALGGRRDIMQMLAPAGRVYQAGTLSGNPLAVAAGLTTLNELCPATYDLLEKRAAQLEAGIRANLEKLSLPYRFQRIGSMACLFFTNRPVRNYNDALSCDTDSFARYYHAMLSNGIYLPPSQFEAFFISITHSEEDIEKTIAANYDALKSCPS